MLMKRYQIAGTTIGIGGTCPTIVAIIDMMFCLCPVSDETPSVVLSGHSANPDCFSQHLPDWIGQVVAGFGESIEPIFTRREEGVFVFLNNGESLSCAWLTANGRRFEFLAAKWKDGPTPLVVQPLIVPLLREIMLIENKLLLHSAAVQFPDGTGALIAAPGYGGKTTTTMSVVRQGAKLLGDDLTVIQPASGQIRLLGIPEPFNLTDYTIETFPELQGVSDLLPQKDPDSKRVFSPVDIYGSDCLIASCQLHTAYFVRLSDEGPAVRRLGANEAMQSFAAMHMFARHQPIDPFFTTELIDILSQIHVYEIQTGTQPEALGQWLATHAGTHANGEVA